MCAATAFADTRPLATFLYPPFPFQESRLRRRRLAVLTPPHDVGGEALLTDEDGTATRVPTDDRFYAQLRSLAAGRAIYHRPGGQWRRLLKRLASTVVEDKSATLLYRPKTGLGGVRWARAAGHHLGGCLLPTSVWPTQDALTDTEWLACVRQTLTALDVGDYDTPGAAGEATLRRWWTASGHDRLFTPGDEVLDMAARFQVGGRAETFTDGSTVYPHAGGLDISSAYPTAVARGLPWGRPTYRVREPRGAEAAYGIWRIDVHDDLPFSPVPTRDWESPGSKLVWHLYEGDSLLYAGWTDEIEALRASGAVTATWTQGWQWPRIDTFLSGWVDAMCVCREVALDLYGGHVASFVKLATNAAIGRWHMEQTRYDIMPDWQMCHHGERDPRTGHYLCQPLDMDPTAREMDDHFSDLAVMPLVDVPSRPLPRHWASYVQMAVRLELWRLCMGEIRSGNKLLQTNFDGAFFERPMAQSSNDYQVIAAQSQRPFRVRVLEARDLWVPYNRAVVGVVEQRGFFMSLPGIPYESRPPISQGMLVSTLVDAMRKRRGV